MADKTVCKELLASAMFLNGTDRYRGDLVDLEPHQAQRLEEAGMVADEGHLAKLAKEAEAACSAASDLEQQRVQLADAEAHRREAHDRDRLVGSQASGDGPRTRRKA